MAKSFYVLQRLHWQRSSSKLSMSAVQRTVICITPLSDVRLLHMVSIAPA
jgi:hypothetical protein